MTPPAHSASLTATARRTRGRPRSGEATDIDEQLLAVALSEFVTNGYGGTSLNQIIRAAGVSKTTLYQRYASKEALFRAIMQRQVERLAPETRLSLEAEGVSLETGLADYANRALAFSLQGDLLEVNRLIYSEASRFPELAQAAAESSRSGIAQIARFIASCSKAEGHACTDPETAATVFIFMLRGWYGDVMLTHAQISPEDRERWVQRTVAALLAGRRGW